METELLGIIPVLPSENIDRDAEWYAKQVGFQLIYKDKMYAIIKRENIFVHLQWHANTKADPLHGGSVIRICVKNLEPLFKELVKKGTIKPNKLRMNTDWNTNEFGFYDLNNNAIFIFENSKNKAIFNK